MRNLTLNTFVIDIVSALLILLFVYTGITKITDFNSYRLVLSKSPLIGSSAGILLWLLPIIELIVAVLLFNPSTKVLGLLFSFLLMCTFTVYVWYMIHFSPDLPCSCGGVFKQMTWNQHLNFNIIVSIVSLTGFLVSITTKSFIAINRESRIPV